MSALIPRVRDLLRQHLARSPEGMIRLSQVGTLLRDQIEGFTPAACGFLSLKELLLSMPDIGDVDSSIPAFVRPRKRMIDPAWWRALHRPADGPQVYLDLESCELIEDPAQQPLEPERYVCIPRVDQEEWLATFSAWLKNLEPELGASLLNLAQTQGFNKELRGLLKANKLDAAWRGFRSEQLQKKMLDWAKQHGLESSLILSTAQHEPPIPATRPALARPATRSEPFVPSRDHDEAAFRTFLRHAIDRMTLDELRELRIPARLLIDP